MPFENVFTDTELCARFIFALVLFPLINNFIHMRGYGKVPLRFYLAVPLPKRLGAVILLFPRKHHDYRVHLFCLISQCVFVLLLCVFIYLSVAGIQLTETVQQILPKCMAGFMLITAAGVVADSMIYEKKHSDEI